MRQPCTANKPSALKNSNGHNSISDMDNFTLIANSGIQLYTFRITINTQDRFKAWFHEWYDKTSGEYKLESVQEVSSEDGCQYYKKSELLNGGYLANSGVEIDPSELKQDGIHPLKIDDDLCPGVSGEIFSLTFSDRENKLCYFENQWLPMPYFFKRTERRFKFGPLNWSRAKLIPVGENKGLRTYDVLLAFDTHTTYGEDENNENPVFPDLFRTDIDFALCDNESFLLDYCSTGKRWSFIDE